MRILFLYPNINVAKPTWWAYGLGCLIAVLKNNGFETEVLPIFSESDYPEVLSKIESFQPRIVGFSSVASQFRFVKKLSKKIKEKFPDLIVVCGGVHPTIYPDCLKEVPWLDGIFRGESDFSFLQFANLIKENKPFYNASNFAYLNEKKEMVLNPLLPQIENLDVLPFPDRESFNYEKIIQSTDGRARFIFNRGCPYSCTFCSNHALAKAVGLRTNKPRYRSPKLAVEEIVMVLERYKNKIKKLFIIDEIFGLNREWLFEFCDLYREAVKLPFECFQRANFIDEKTVKALKNAGCYSVAFGIESGSDFIRNKIMNRNMSKEQIIYAFGVCHKVGLKTTASNIIGLPFETREMIYETIELNRRVLPYGSVVGIFYPYPGTDLEKLCREKNLINEEKINNPDFVERKGGSVLDLEISDDELNWFLKNWLRLIYKNPKTMLLHPRRLICAPVFRKLKKMINPALFAPLESPVS